MVPRPCNRPVLKLVLVLEPSALVAGTGTGRLGTSTWITDTDTCTVMVLDLVALGHNMWLYIMSDIAPQMLVGTICDLQVGGLISDHAPVYFRLCVTKAVPPMTSPLWTTRPSTSWSSCTTR